jgi:hypothetical protein
LEFTRIEVIGDFPEDAAREFAQDWLNRLRLARGQAAVAITETEWAMMYDVCGGNALQLTNAVIEWNLAMNREKGDARPIETLERGKDDRDANTHLAAAWMHFLAPCLISSPRDSCQASDHALLRRRLQY